MFFYKSNPSWQVYFLNPTYAISIIKYAKTDMFLVNQFSGRVRQPKKAELNLAKVRDIKHEIAFHGDTLNTAAHLLKLCKEFEKNLLVSGMAGKA